MDSDKINELVRQFGQGPVVLTMHRKVEELGKLLEMNMQPIASRNDWTIVSSPNDDREGYNIYAVRNGDIIGSVDMLTNEGAYEDSSGFIKPVPKPVLAWLDKVWLNFDWDTGEYHGN